MALDRTWFNTLVDDAGDGMSGSVWDKADVDSLMDAIDAEIARIDRYASGAWTPTLRGASGGTPAYVTQTGTYSRYRDLVQVSGRITLSSKGSLAGPLIITLPVASHPASAHALAVGDWAGTPTGATAIHIKINGGEDQGYLVKGSASVGATLLDASEISNSFDIIFGGAYHGVNG